MGRRGLGTKARIVYTADGRPIEATSMVKAGHLYEVQYEFATE